MWKFFSIVFVTLLALSAQAASVAYTGPFLTQITEPGYVKPGYAVSSECEVFADRLVLTKKYYGAGMVVTQEKKLNLLNQDLFKTILAASHGEIKESTGSADVPSVFQRAYLVGDSGQAAAVILSEVNGDNGKRKINISPEGQFLSWLLGQLCD